MSGKLWGDIVFGPIKSRRLGISLGINLLPGNLKICTFNCVYCECGWGEEIDAIEDKVFTYDEIISTLEDRMKQLKSMGETIDSITYAGNGEPTMHPDFARITDHVIALRDTYFPNAKTACLSNSTLAYDATVRNALLKLDNIMLKLDAGSQEMFDIINRPFTPIDMDDIVEHLIEFKGKLTIQTLFLKGEYEGEIIDNTSESEIKLWLDKIVAIQPQKVIIYPIDRSTPARHLQKLSNEQMQEIAHRVEELGLKCEIYG